MQLLVKLNCCKTLTQASIGLRAVVSATESLSFQRGRELRVTERSEEKSRFWHIKPFLAQSLTESERVREGKVTP
jgi:hypothetical protein